PGGALEVFKTLIQQERKAHPDAEMKVFTMIADQDLKRLTLQIPGTANQGTITVVEALPQRVSNLFTTSSRQRIPIFSVLFDYRNLIIFYPRIMHLLSRKIRRFQPESILISSFAIAKNITLSCLSGRGGKARAFRQPITKLYLHSPMQYIWSHREEYLAKFTGRKKMLFTFLVPRLQKWDKQFTQFNEVSFNSTYTQRLAKEIYGLEGKVVYPNIHDAFYFAGVNLQPQEYFVCVGRLVSFVRECDLIINAFNQLKLPLLMVGAGPDEVFLKSIAKDTILFLGRLSPEETQKIVRNAKALINLTKESF
ncbi:MAG: hypothetical protein LBG52_06280, partial [Candidatus Peribacteria bacterium]|nr:hypothetical protein [Candidatus Peribacteria bacterium]